MESQPLEASRRLFVYGSLLLPTGDAEVDRVLSASTRSLGEGYIHGRLYDLGDYPGAKPARPEEGRETPRVRGRLLELLDAEAVLAVLDAYEGFDARTPAGGEFLRTAATVHLPEAGVSRAAQVYYYNPPADGLDLIPSGDYLAFRQAKEKRP